MFVITNRIDVTKDTAQAFEAAFTDMSCHDVVRHALVGE